MCLRGSAEAERMESRSGVDTGSPAGDYLSCGEDYPKGVQAKGKGVSYPKGVQAKGKGVSPEDQVRLPKAVCGVSCIRKHAISIVVRPAKGALFSGWESRLPSPEPGQQ